GGGRGDGGADRGDGSRADEPGPASARSFVPAVASDGGGGGGARARRVAPRVFRGPGADPCGRDAVARASAGRGRGAGGGCRVGGGAGCDPGGCDRADRGTSGGRSGAV